MCIQLLSAQMSNASLQNRLPALLWESIEVDPFFFLNKFLGECFSIRSKFMNNTVMFVMCEKSVSIAIQEKEKND